MSRQVYPGELIAEVAAQTEVQGRQLNEAAIKAHAKMVLSLIREGLLQDGEVRIHEFGTFRLKRSKSRVGINPQTGERIQIPAKPRVQFTPAKALREAVEPIQPAPIPLPPMVAEMDARAEEAIKPIPVMADEVEISDLRSASESSTEAKETESGWRWGKLAVAAALVLAIGLLLWNRPDPATPPQVPPVAQAPTTTQQGAENRDETVSKPKEPQVAKGPSDAPAPTVESAPPATQAASAGSSATAPEAEPATATLQEAPPEIELAAVPAKGAVTEESLTPTEMRIEPEDQAFFLATEYELAPGNSLWRLAASHYLDPVIWPHIFNHNQDQIDNPNLIRAGAVITLPTLYGHPDALWQVDRRSIAEGYFLVYRHMVENGHMDAPYALLAVAHFDKSVVREHEDEIRDIHPYLLRITHLIDLEEQRTLASATESGIPLFR